MELVATREAGGGGERVHSCQRTDCTCLRRHVLVILCLCCATSFALSMIDCERMNLCWDVEGEAGRTISSEDAANVQAEADLEEGGGGKGGGGT